MSNLEILMKMFPGRLILNANEVLSLINIGYSTFANAAGANKAGENLDLSKFPPIYDANCGRRKIAKWEINLVDLAKWIDDRGIRLS